MNDVILEFIKTKLDYHDTHIITKISKGIYEQIVDLRLLGLKVLTNKTSAHNFKELGGLQAKREKARLSEIICKFESRYDERTYNQINIFYLKPEVISELTVKQHFKPYKFITIGNNKWRWFRGRITNFIREEKV